jgi:DNA-binding response OmpR family regulator
VEETARILVVEDEPLYRYLLQLNLEASNYVVELAEDARTGLQQVIDDEPDLILLDLLLPDLDGMEFCRQVRRFSTVPIVMVTARAEQKDVIAGLNAGADDYVTKPFSVAELLARIEANLRRRAIDRAPTVTAIIQTGDLTIDRSRQRVFLGGAEIQLTDIEFRLLDELARHLGHVVSATHLLETVWGPGYEDASKVLHQSIYRLRHKIERDPAEPHYLLNRSRQGYLLVNLARR